MEFSSGTCSGWDRGMFLQAPERESLRPEPERNQGEKWGRGAALRCLGARPGEAGPTPSPWLGDPGSGLEPEPPPLASHPTPRAAGGRAQGPQGLGSVHRGLLPAGAAPRPHLGEVGLELHLPLVVHVQDGGRHGCAQVQAQPQFVHDDLGREGRRSRRGGGTSHPLPAPRGAGHWAPREGPSQGEPQTHLDHRRDDELPPGPADHQLRPPGRVDQDGGDHGRGGPLPWNWRPRGCRWQPGFRAGALHTAPLPVPSHYPTPWLGEVGSPRQRPLSPGGPPHSPGGGVPWAPGRRRQHRSRSWLLRRMPVRGEYTIAPKLRGEGAGLRDSLPGAPHYFYF